MVLGVLGIVTLATPLRCLPGIAGSGICGVNSATDIVEAPGPAAVPASHPQTTATPAKAASAPLSAPSAPGGQPAQAAAPTPKGLVAATFNLLQTPPQGADSGTSAKVVTPAKAADGGPAATANAAPIGPTTRMVKTVPIHANVAANVTMGLQKPVTVASVTPFVPQSATIAPTPAPAPAPKAEEAPKPTPVKQAALEAPAKPAPAAKGGSTSSYVVGGAGVNVRSGPSKSKGVLFALAGGKTVSVSEDQKGWLHITDEKGREGWVYKTFLVKR